MPVHRWIRAETRYDRAPALAEPGGRVLAHLDAHRRLRGPYTAGGQLLRLLVPDLLVTRPDLVARHDVEILSLAPELRAMVPASRETLTSLAIPTERTRFYSRLRTARLAHGVADLLRDHLADTGGGASLTVEGIDEADPTDRELLAILLRRIDPALLCLNLAGRADGGQEPPGPVAEPLAPALERYTECTDMPRRTYPAVTDPARAAADYVVADCVADAAPVLEAYRHLPAGRRAALHDARADELAARGERSLELGAIAYHREHGSDPAGAGVAALRAGLEYCVDMGFYHATVDFGERGRALLPDRYADTGEEIPVALGRWWTFTSKMTTSLAALGRAPEALACYDDARAAAANPVMHMQAAYATAMLYTRHLAVGERDNRRARAWCNESIALAGLLPDPKLRAFQMAFNNNGLALVAVHEGRLSEALELVDRGIAVLDATLADDEHALHRSVLLSNRAQVYAALGRTGDALADLDEIIVRDPNYAEYYLDRGNLLRRVGRDTDALADYDRARRLSPPFPEVHYNRGDAYLEVGEPERALNEFDRVLELDPAYLAARISRADLRWQLGDAPGAHADVATGLAAEPGNARLLCLSGQLLSDTDPRAAESALSEAVAAEPTLDAAWAARGVLRHEQGRADEALADLDRALEISEDATARYNRGMLLLSLGRHDAADTDLRAALAADASFANEIRRYRPGLTATAR